MKKLTAGIFTVMLGLVAVNAANAAIPSTNYVDTKIGDVETAYKAADAQIRTDFADADTTTLNSAKGYTDQQVGTLTGLTTSAKDNTVAAINEVNEAYKTADTNLLTNKIGTDTMGEIKTAEDAAVNPTTLTQAVNALNAKIDYKTSGIATDAALSDLTTQVNTNKSDITGLKGDVQTLTSADTTNLQAAKDYADSLATNYDAAGAAATAETNAKAYADGLAGNYDTKGSAAAAQEAAESYADSLATNYDAAGAAATAETNAKAYANTELAKKVNIAQGTANQVMITDGDGNVTTAAQIANTQVAGLGGLATKTTIADADVADGAAIAQSKIAGLTTSLSDLQNTKVTIPTATGADGNYVLTATVVGDQTTYKWESISREEESNEE